jgi:hypothetical protein
MPFSLMPISLGYFSAWYQLVSWLVSRLAYPEFLLLLRTLLLFLDLAPVSKVVIPSRICEESQHT